MGAEIPLVRDVHPCYCDAVKKAEQQLADLINMYKPDQKEAAFEEHKRAVIEKRSDWEAQRLAQNALFESMIARLEKWEPPTSSHASLKKFMRDQLEISICRTAHERPVFPSTADEWHTRMIKKAAENLEYARAQLQQEKRRVEQRNEWVAALKAGLPE